MVIAYQVSYIPYRRSVIVGINLIYHGLQIPTTCIVDLFSTSILTHSHTSKSESLVSKFRRLHCTRTVDQPSNWRYVLVFIRYSYNKQTSARLTMAASSLANWSNELFIHSWGVLWTAGRLSLVPLTHVISLLTHFRYHFQQCQLSNVTLIDAGACSL